MRAFIAIMPPQEAIDDLDDFLDVRRAAAPLRWTDPEHFHVTLASAPDLAERCLDELCERLDRFFTRKPAFATRIEGGGAFPDATKARVLWAGLGLDETERQRLGRLSHDTRQVATKAGVATHGGRFKAHITVARTRPTEASSWVRLLQGYVGPPWTATEVALVQSRLGEGRGGRPRYDRLQCFEIGGA
ncbi:MAG: RNA 2',3'-cyclic phosphodiesterase [Nocardioidaceae bacterium]